MKNNQSKKLTRDSICLIAYGVIFVLCALAFWLFCPPDGAGTYSIVAIWFVMPLASLLFSYIIAIPEKLRGWKRLVPFICGGALALLEYVTFSLKNMIAFPGNINYPSISLVIFGILASLIGLHLAKQDRKENAKASAKVAKAKKASVEETVETSEPEATPGECDADTGADVPSEDNDIEKAECLTEAVPEENEISESEDAEEQLNDEASLADGEELVSENSVEPCEEEPGCNDTDEIEDSEEEETDAEEANNEKTPEETASREEPCCDNEEVIDSEDGCRDASLG